MYQIYPQSTRYAFRSIRFVHPSSD